MISIVKDTSRQAVTDFVEPTTSTSVCTSPIAACPAEGRIELTGQVWAYGFGAFRAVVDAPAQAVKGTRVAMADLHLPTTRGSSSWSPPT